MSLRKCAHAAVVLSAALAVTASLTSLAPAATAQLPAPEATSPVSSAGARVAATTPSARAGASAGRTAGAAAGTRAGRIAGRAAGGDKGARAGAAAGRRAGAIAGARAGRAAGAKVSLAAAKRAGARAGKRAGTRAGTRAGRLAGRAAVGPSCGTVVYYKPDGTRWRCVLGDDFNGTSLNSARWRVMTSDEFNFGARKDCFMNRPANVSVSGGVLNLVARRERSSFRCHRGKGTYLTQYSAGMVSTYQKWAQAYGRFEFRAKFPYTTQRGLQTSLWLWPKDATGAIWPVSGEIDVAEWYSQWPDRSIPFLHYASLDTGKATNNQCYVDGVQDWHTYLLEWKPGSIKISYDGKVCLENDSIGSPFNKPYLLAMFGGFGLNRNVPTASTPALNRTQIAWVRVWG
ncbi:MAG: family 16 glycosylhydrolase [Marmoricola sp.]